MRVHRGNPGAEWRFGGGGGGGRLGPRSDSLSYKADGSRRTSSGKRVVDAPRNLPRAILLGVIAVIIMSISWLTSLTSGHWELTGWPGAADRSGRHEAHAGLHGGTLIAARIAVSTSGFLIW